MGQTVVACHDDVEPLEGQRRDLLERPGHRRAAVAGEDADAQPGVAKRAHQFDGALVRRGAGRALQLEELQRSLGRVALFPLQTLDELEHEAVRRAADLPLDGVEVEGPGMRERAVEVEQDGAQPERP